MYKIVFLFSGQGSHYYNMAGQLFEKEPSFYRWMIYLDNIVYTYIGQSVIENLYCQRNKFEDKFDRLIFSHPAIFMVEYSLAMLLIENGIKPDVVVGASLGEFVSAAVAGVSDMENILEAVVRQAFLVEALCPKGGMTAVLGKPDLYYDNHELKESSELGAINSKKHFVISGNLNQLDYAENFLNEKKVPFARLPVSYAFHSSHISPIIHEYSTVLSKIKYSAPSIDYISSLFGEKVTSVNEEFFWNVIRYPISFWKASQCLELYENCVFIDLGTGTLANFIKDNVSNSNKDRIFSIVNIFGNEMENLKRVLNNIQKGIVRI